MKRRIALAASTLGSIALLAAAAPGASAVAPPGNGLLSFGTFTCQGFGDVSVFGPRGGLAATSFTTTGQHVVLLSLNITGTDPEGNPIEVSKTYGQAAALTPVTCTQHSEEGGASIDAVAVVALVPPQ